jgi:hypothetical protein
MVNVIKKEQTLQHTIVLNTFHYDLDSCVVLGTVYIDRYNCNYIETTTP